RALAVAHVAVALHANPWHEALRAGDVCDEIVDAVGVAVAIVKAQIRRGDAGEGALARRRVWIGPYIEPGVDHPRRAGVDRIGDDVREEGQLIAPALDVIVADRFVVHLVRESQASAGAQWLELDRDA